MDSNRFNLANVLRHIVEEEMTMEDFILEYNIDEKELEVCKLWNENKSYRQIRKETGVNLGKIQQIAKDNNLIPKPSPPKKYKPDKNG